MKIIEKTIYVDGFPMRVFEGPAFFPKVEEKRPPKKATPEELAQSAMTAMAANGGLPSMEDI